MPNKRFARRQGAATDIRKRNLTLGLGLTRLKFATSAIGTSATCHEPLSVEKQPMNGITPTAADDPTETLTAFSE
jgi:hypothetical protein